MTAEELWDKHFSGLYWDDITPEREQRYAIEFARYHVEQALKLASDNAIVKMKEGMEFYYEDYVEGVDKDSILNSYPAENIK